MQLPDLRYWIWLSEACGAGSRSADLLLSAFSEDAKAIYDADESAYAELEELSDKTRKALCQKDLSEAEKILDYCQRNNVSLLCPAHAAYPDKLRAIRCRPVLLYYKGSLPDFDSEVCIAMVGTRRMSEYGKRTAYLMSYDLARGGAIVVSGMAAGVDGMAHRGALDASGHTVAILGCGIDRAYPTFHRDLMDELFVSGTVMTEFKPFTEPMGQNFPIRNRIISGLCQGTAVIEADLRSGAMITARNALYQGRDLFAVPGKVGEQNSDGTHQLIKNGAKMVTDAQDILEEYEFLYPDKIHIDRLPRYLPKHSIHAEQETQTGEQSFTQRERREQAKEKKHTPAAKPARPAPEPPQKAEPAPAVTPVTMALSEKEAAVLSLLERAVSVDCDFLCRQSGLPIHTVMSALTLLEIKRLIEALPGGLYRRI